VRLTHEEEETRIRAIFDSSPDAITVSDLNGNITECNQATLDLHGFSSKEELIGKNALELIAGKDHQRAMENLKKTLEQGSVRSIEYTFLTKDGREFPAELSASVIKDSSGNPTGFVAITEDITERKKAEEELIRLSSAVKMSTDSIVISDLGAKIVDVNEATLEMYGTDDKGDLIGKDSFDLIVPEDREKAFASMKEVLEKGYVKSREYHIIIKDGSRIPVEMSTAIMKDADGKPIGFVAISRDITERKRVEEALRESEKRYRCLIEKEKDIIYTLDVEGNVTFASPAVETILGYQPEEVIGKNFMVLIPEEWHEKTGVDFNNLLKTGEITAETVLLDKNGKPHFVEYSSTVIKEGGKVVGARGIVRDITERKRAEEALRRSEEQARHLLEFQSKVIDTAVAWIDLLDAEGNVTLWNRAAELISGYSREEVTGHKGIWEWLYPDPEYRARIFAQAKKIIEKGERVENFETTIRCKDGALKTISWYSNNILDQKGKLAGSIAVGIDITERKRFEESLSTLNTYSRNLNRAESVEGIYRLTLDAMEKTLGFEHASFMVVDKGMLYVVDQRGFPDSHASLKLPLNGTKGGVTVKAAKTGRPVLVPDTRKERAYVEGAPGMRSELAVPIKTGHKLLGVLNVESKTLDAFDEKDQRLLEILASHAATAMSNSEHAKNLETYAREIRESQEKFERLFMSNPEAAIYLDSDSHILDVNSRFEELFGYSLDEIKGMRINDVVVPKDMMKEGKMLDEKALKGYLHNDTVRKRKDGSLVPVSISAAPLIVEGKTVGVMGVYKDITQQKKAEEALRRSEEQARRLLEFQNKVIDTAVAWIDLLDAEGNVTLWNRAAELISGYSREEVTGHKGIWEWLYPDPEYRAKIFAEAKKVIEKGEHVENDETTIRCKDGTLKTIRWYENSILDERRKPVGYIAVGVDFTERKQMEKKLEEYSHQLEEMVEERTKELLESERRYSTLLELANDGVLILHNGIFILVNKKTEEITEYSKEELLGMPFLELISEKHREIVMDRYKQRLEGKTVPQIYEIEIVTKNGHTVPVEVSAKLIDYRGKPADLVIARDIRERKRMEEERLRLEKLATTGELATMVGHDLRNPLQAIENAAYYLNNELSRLPSPIPIPQKAMEMLQVLNDSVDYADKIIRDLKDFASTKKPILEKTDINAIVKSALSQVGARKNVELITELDHLPKIEVDIDMIKRVFLNLAINGIQAMEKGGTITVSTKKTNGFVEASFKDTGVGISKENMEKIFTPFFTTRAKGMGMGLPICKKFVEAHGGSIQVESEEGKGSTFTVKLPIRQENGGEKLDEG